MIRKFAALALVLMLAASFCVPAGYAEYRCERCGKAMYDKDMKGKFFKKAHFILKNQKELDLSDRQIDQIKKLKADVKKDMINKRAKTDLLKVEIETEMWEDPMNLNAINSLIEQKYEVKKEKAKALAAAYAKLKGILTEDQKEELTSLWHKR